MCYTPKSHLKITNKTAPYNQSPKSIIGATDSLALESIGNMAAVVRIG